MEIEAESTTRGNTTEASSTWVEVLTPTARTPNIPLPENAQFWVDFDGTITRRDVLDELILQYAADDSWQEVEKLWQAGKIGSLECLTREFDVVRVERGELRKFLQHIPIDPGVTALFSLARENGVPLAILSDGIEQFIRPILARAGVGEVTIRSNAIEHRGTQLKLLCPHNKSTCESRAAHCKCASAALLGEPGRKSIYVGDGRSDLCPARKCDVVFAKGALAKALGTEGRAFIPFDTLNDVVAALSAAWSLVAK